MRRNAAALRSGLRELGYRVGDGPAPIVPVIVGEDRAAYYLARRLLDHGVLATAVVAPAVPRGEARLRLCATAAQSDEDINAALDAFDRVRTQRAGAVA